MRRIINSNEQRLINIIARKIREACKGFIGTPEPKAIFQKLLYKTLDDVDEYEPIVGPTLPRSNDGDSVKFK